MEKNNNKLKFGVVISVVLMIGITASFWLYHKKSQTRLSMPVPSATTLSTSGKVLTVFASKSRYRSPFFKWAARGHRVSRKCTAFFK